MLQITLVFVVMIIMITIGFRLLHDSDGNERPTICPNCKKMTTQSVLVTHCDFCGWVSKNKYS